VDCPAGRTMTRDGQCVTTNAQVEAKGVSVFLKLTITQQTFLNDGMSQYRNVSFGKFPQLVPAMFTTWKSEMVFMGVRNTTEGERELRYLAVLLVDQDTVWHEVYHHEIIDVIKPILGKRIVLQLDWIEVECVVGIMPIEYNKLNTSHVYGFNISHWERLPMQYTWPSKTIDIVETMFCYLVKYCDDEFDIIGTGPDLIYIHEVAQYYWPFQHVMFSDIENKKCVMVCLETTPYELPASKTIALSTSSLVPYIAYISCIILCYVSNYKY